jgi:predicted peroxiredoxin
LLTPDQYYVADATGKELLKSTDIAKDDKDTVDVAFTGLGFFACKKKVLDALEYPYFTNILSDEVSFCKSIVEKGFKVMLCKELRVGRSMTVLL